MTTAVAESFYLPTGLDLDRLAGATLNEARELAAALGAIARGHQWWIGDLLVHAEDVFGEEGAQLEAELDIGPKTAANYRYVAAHVPISRRREDLSWSHHAEVARLTGSQQLSALARAARESWSVLELRLHVATAWPADGQLAIAGTAGPAPVVAEAELQARLERLQLALEASRDGSSAWYELITVDDVAWLLSLVRGLTRHGRD